MLSCVKMLQDIGQSFTRCRPPRRHSVWRDRCYQIIVLPCWLKSPKSVRMICPIILCHSHQKAVRCGLIYSPWTQRLSVFTFAEFSDELTSFIQSVKSIRCICRKLLFTFWGEVGENAPMLLSLTVSQVAGLSWVVLWAPGGCEVMICTSRTDRSATAGGNTLIVQNRIHFKPVCI